MPNAHKKVSYKKPNDKFPHIINRQKIAHESSNESDKSLVLIYLTNLCYLKNRCIGFIV